MKAEMRGLPAVHRFLAEPRVERYEAELGRETLKRAIEGVLERARCAQFVPHYDNLLDAILERLAGERMDSLLEVVNATGVLLHTNLGRAPIARGALDEAARIGGGYSNLEYDLARGERGSRYERLTPLLRELTGADAALVINNCAAAVLLILDTLARGRETIVARNQLIEIGGSFRLPDVFQRSGSRLVEVGATNKVYLHDYERALSPHTALIFRSHASNFRIVGFTHETRPAELAALAHRAGIPLVEDLGSGALCDLKEYGLAHERTVGEALRDGADLVAFSGDKLLAGPQAGIIVGTTALVARLRSNPLLRALRVDKITIAALAATLRLHRTPEGRATIPFYAMLAATQAQLRERARSYCSAIAQAKMVESRAAVGGGSLPQSSLASIAIALDSAQPAVEIAARLRRNEPAVVARIAEGRVALDLRTVLPRQDALTIEALRRALA